MTTQLLILDEIEARLSNMTITNGYATEVGKIERARLKPYVLSDLPTLNYWPTPDIVVGKDFGKESHELGITIEMHTVTRDEPFTDIAFKLGGQIITAVNRSTSLPLISDVESLALGGLVTETLANSVTPTIGEGQSPWCGVLVDLTIKYNTNVGDVFNIINF